MKPFQVFNYLVTGYSKSLKMETEISDLPEELLVKIFKYLQKSDLLSLTLQSKRFNRLICQEFMNELNLYVSPLNIDTEWIGSRKYTSVDFNEKCSQGNILNFACILADFGVFITTLDMSELTIEPSTFKLILSMCRNLKIVYLPELTNHALTNDSLKNWPRLDLIVLNCYARCGRALQLLRDSSTKTLSFDKAKSIDSYGLLDFLEFQKNVEFLDLTCKKIDLFRSDSLNNVDFRLKTLKLGYVPIQNTENFTKFMLTRSHMWS